MKKYTVNTEETYKDENGELATMTGSHQIMADSEEEAVVNVKKLLFKKERVTSVHQTVEKKKK